MAISRHYLPEHRFMLSWLRGAVDDEALYEHVVSVDEDIRDIEVPYRELADCRDVDDLEGVSVRGTTECARRNRHKTGWRLALLITPDDPVMYGMARAFQMFVEDHLEDVHIFTDILVALDWLADDKTERDVFMGFVHARTRGSGARGG